MWSAPRRGVHPEDESTAGHRVTPPAFGDSQMRSSSPVPPPPRQQLNNHWGPPPASSVMTEGFVAAPRGLPPALQRRMAPTQQQPPSHSSITSFAPPPPQPSSHAPWQQPSHPVQPEAEHYDDYEDEDGDGGALTTTINLVASAASALFQRATAVSPNHPKAPPPVMQQHVRDNDELHQPVLQQLQQPLAPSMLSPTTSMLGVNTTPVDDTNFQHESMLQAQSFEDTVSVGTAFPIPTAAPPNAFVQQPSSANSTPVAARSTPVIQSTPLPPIATTPRRQLPTPQPPSTHHRSFLQRPPPAIRSSPRQHSKPKFKLPPPVPLSLGGKKNTPPMLPTPSPPVTPSMTSMTLPPTVESTQESARADPQLTSNNAPSKSAFQTAVDMEVVVPTPLQMTMTTTEPTKETVVAPPAPSSSVPVPFIPSHPGVEVRAPPHVTARQGPPPPTQATPQPTASWTGVPPPAGTRVPAASANVANVAPPQFSTANIVTPQPPTPTATQPAAPPTAQQPPTAPAAVPPVGPPSGPKRPFTVGPPTAPPAVFPVAPPGGASPVFSAGPPTVPPVTFPVASPAGPSPVIPAGPPSAPPAAFSVAPPAGPPPAVSSGPPTAPPAFFDSVPLSAVATGPPVIPPPIVSVAPPVGPPAGFPIAPPAGPPTAPPNASIPPVAPSVMPLTGPALPTQDYPPPPTGLPPFTAPSGPSQPQEQPEAKSVIPPPQVQEQPEASFMSHLNAAEELEERANDEIFDQPPEREIPGGETKKHQDEGDYLHSTTGNRDEDLVDGWVQEWDTGSGLPYFFNVYTQETTWEKPDLHQRQSEKCLEQVNGSWLSSVDENENEDEKLGRQREEQSATPESTLLSATKNADELPPLPDGWVEEVDESTAQPFYYNIVTQETTWDRPTLLSEPSFRKPVNETETKLEPEDEKSGNAGGFRGARESDFPESTSSTKEAVEDYDPSCDDDTQQSNAYEGVAEPRPTFWNTPEGEVGEGMPRSTEAAPELQTASNQPEISVENTGETFLPIGWCELQDPDSGLTYFYNEDTQETTWERPQAAELREGGSEAKEVVAACQDEGTETLDESAKQGVSAIQQLPDGWVEEFDLTSSRPYYYNTLTNETTWDRPVPCIEEDDFPDSYQESDMAGDGVELNAVDPVESTDYEFDSADHKRTHELPPGWVRGVDRSSGRPYYYFFDDPIVTRSWNRPSSPDIPIHWAPFFEDGEDDESVPLPHGWLENKDPSTGKRFYYLETDKVGTATWRRPSAKAFVPSLDVLEEEVIDKGQVETFETVANVPEEHGRLVSETATFQDAVMVDGEGVQELPATERMERDPFVDRTETEILPEGWTKHLDPTSGLHYYYNAIDEATSWDPPALDIQREVVHEHDDHEQKLGEETNETRPEQTQHEEDLRLLETHEKSYADTSNLGTPAPEDTLVSKECDLVAEYDELPEGWEELIDETSGMKYYYCLLDNTTTWEKPKALKEASRSPYQMVSPVTEASPEGEINDAKQICETSAGPVAEEEEAPEEEIVERNKTTVLDEDALDENGYSMPQNPELEVEKITSPETVPLSSLPHGWVELNDEDSGMKYYFYEPDGTSTWERPVPVVEGSEHALETIDSAEPPVAESANLQNEATSIVGGSHGETQDLVEEQDIAPSDEKEEALPPGWVELVDSASGNPYYFHETDGIAAWERPKISAESQKEVDGQEETNEPLEILEIPENSKLLAGNEITLVGESPESKVLDPHAAEVAFQDDKAELQYDADREIRSEVPDDTNDLPPGWVESTDPASGNPYFLNEAENLTTWERPTRLQSAFNENGPESDANQELVSDEQPKVADTIDEQHGEVMASDEQLVPLSEGWVDVTDPSVSGECYTPTDSKVSFGESTPEETVNAAKVDADENPNELPQGWLRLIDPGSGNPFYFNESENVTTWEAPVPNPVPLQTDFENVSSPNEGNFTPTSVLPDVHLTDAVTSMVDETKRETTSLPEGWVEVIDTASGLPYYLNQELNITSWERPASVEGTEEANSSAPTVTNPIGIDLTIELPSGWVEMSDPSTGQVFYFNENDNISTWERPGQKEAAENSGLDDSLERLKSHSFATFGFAGKMCSWSRGSGQIVVLRNCRDFAVFDDVASVESAKRKYGLDGPLNSCEESIVMKYLEGRTREKPSDLLWSLILIAAKSKGRLRSDEGVRNPDGPEAAIVNLLLNDSNNANVTTNGGLASGAQLGANGSTSSLEKVQSLLLRGKREDAVQEALFSHNYAMALLVATMCDRECYQRAVKEFADHALTAGSPLHTISLLFSAQLQPLAERALDGSEPSSSVWGSNADELRHTWKYHLAALISNRTAGWDKIVLTLGDRLLELGDVKEAHFCYMVCGSPLSSPSNPSSRMAIVGCDHLVPMDVALMTTEGIDAYERSEAYEWAKRLGNRNAAIQSLQPFKLIYASLLCDLGFKSTAERYLQSIRLCAGLSATEQRGNAIPSPFASFSDRASLAHAIDDIEARLHMQPSPEARKTDTSDPKISAREELPPAAQANSSSCTISNDLVQPNDDDMTFVSAKSNLLDMSDVSRFESKDLNDFGRGSKVRVHQESGSAHTKSVKLESKATKSRETSDSKPVQKNVKSTATSIDNEKTPMTTKSSVRSPRGTLRARNVDGVTKKSSSDGKKRFSDRKEKKEPSDVDKNSPGISQQSVSEGGPPIFSPLPTVSRAEHTVLAPSKERSHAPLDQSALLNAQASPNSVVGPPKAVATEKQEQVPSKPAAVASPVSAPLPARQEPPMSAPAVMAASASNKSSKPPAAPSSEKKGRTWGLGIKATMTKWLNPDAKTADLGEGMQAYYDEKRKVWVFPGEDPDEKVKPIAPPPIIPVAADASTPSQPETPRSNDPLAAMMAPPKRTPASLPRGVGSRAPSHNAPFSPAGAGGPPPQFAVFQPKPTTS